ncbi:MAG TPA: RNA pseudouridine synthase, partial [Methylomirabilota bacterium]|nr:RNA pseudouridine synthase [Methylomirabilota bacterium]
WLATRGDRRIFVVHRLDRETSGLLVFAKSLPVKRALQAQFRRRTPERIYLARVEGVVRESAGELTSHLVEDRALRVRSRRDAGRGKEAVTRYRVLERYRDATLLELALLTGRRGQLRAQLAALGHPIVGDRAYGSRRDPLRRVCLHAIRLGFVHPSGRRIVFESPPPPAFRRP